jgi:hypothetical protein
VVQALAVLLFASGLLLAVRVMFFGVQKRVDDEHLAHRRWPLALAAFFVATGALMYARVASTRGVTVGWLVLVVLVGLGAGAGAWWLVQRSAAIPSSDPEDDPRYRFQGHVARVIEPIVARAGAAPSGRIAFSFDGKRHELRACWLPEGDWHRPQAGVAESEVVIERVEDEVAYVEPWTAVEERL